MSDADTINQAIVENATGPKRAQNDSTSAEQHSLPDQVAAAEHLAANEGVKKPGRGLRFTKLVPDGC